MIENPLPDDWKALQKAVCNLLSEVGLHAETEKVIETPRGRVEIDVYATDENSLDKIVYVIECKNWSNSIPQSVVHSFTTVMHETGANIGFIISKVGFQGGAIQYAKNTNIDCLTFGNLQKRYFPAWFERFFVKKIGDVVDTLVQYVEPFNSFRFRKYDELPSAKKKHFDHLLEKNRLFGMAMAFFEFQKYSSRFALDPPSDIESFKQMFSDQLGRDFVFQAAYFRDLCDEMVSIIETVTKEFDQIFGGNIFA